MEEVWKDISLASLHDRPSINDSITAAAAFSGGLTFQDFLSRPLGKNPPPTAVADGGGFGSPAASPPAIGLSLNSGPDRFSLLGNCDENPFSTNSMLQDRPISNNIVSPSLNVMSFDGLASSSLGKKRFSESESNSGDRRHKRMIKNRESAARSRARKQAYTNELELEVAHLMEENARLKRQQQQLCLAAAAQVPKKHILHRTSTAPF
ncbi:protein FD-like [Camellia sinensis]|uniref:FD protein n=1 Tax=Camellia sinensis TaxID=4442 RepID=A0AA96LAI4_CAMSI|nr:protein FD-like [Camellia sinensis]WNQ08809.1 FD protein [Camellia sinensis]